MVRLVSSDLWKHLRRLGSDSRRRMAAVAYVTDASGLGFKRGDTVILDASDGAIRSGETAKAAVSALAKRGVHLFSFAGLHAKVFLFDRVAVVGSSNVSASSRTQLLEAGIMTDHPAVTSQVRAFIEALQRRALPIDEQFLRHMRALPVERRPWHLVGTRRRLAVRPKDSPPQTWLVGVRELDETRYSKEEKLVERGEKEASKHLHRKSSDTSWMRFTGPTPFRRSARAGDSVVEIFTPLGAKRPTVVFRHAPILLRQDEGKRRTRVFVEEYADEDKLALSWGEFKKLAERVGIMGIGQFSNRLLSEDQSQALYSLWGK